MTVKIVGRLTPPTWEAVCDCGTVFIYESDDIDEYAGNGKYVPCPYCSEPNLHFQSKELERDFIPKRCK